MARQNDHQNYGRQNLITRSALLGLAGAMRAWSPLATVALTHDIVPEDSGYKKWPVFNSKLGRLALVAFGVGEYVADKWPRTIDRTRPLPQPSHIDGGIIIRTAFATAAGAALGSQYRQDDSVGVGAAVCTGTAFVANYAFEHFRKAIVEWSGLHDFTVAMMEDQICVGLCAAVANMGPPKQASAKQLDHATSADQDQDHQSQHETERMEQYA